jgi:RNA recognition motif-containing protein
MATKLYIGNLSYNSTEQDLRDMFSQAGEINEIAVISDRSTGQSKGFAFVTMATEQGSQEAISRFNGQSLNDREIVVNEARPREERSGGGRNRY